MSVVYARPRLAYSKQLAEMGVQRFREEWIVRSDSPTESRAAILAAVPSYGTVHAECLYAVCVDVEMNRDEQNPYLWHVFATWSTHRFDRNPTEDQKPPDQRMQRWTARFVELPWEFDTDLDGKPYVTTSGVPLDPKPRRPLFVDEWTCELYTATCNRTTDRGLMNFTNTDTWNGCAPGTALVRDIDCRYVYEYGDYWFLKTYRIYVNPRYTVEKYGMRDEDGFDVTTVGGYDPLLILNASSCKLQQKAGTSDYEFAPINAGGAYDGRPRPLSMGGNPLPLNSSGKYSVGSIVYLAFRVVGKTAFASISPTLTPPWST